MRRISIRSVMVFIVVAAVALAAIRIGSPPWAGAMTSITFFVMTCSVLGAVLRRGVRRIYWLGFAALGWTYLILSYAPWLDVRTGQNLLAPNLFAYLFDVLHSDNQEALGLQSVPLGPFGASAAGGGGGGGGVGFQELADLMRIGIAIEALLWAFLGGWVARYFASGNDGRSGPQSDRAPQGA